MAACMLLPMTGHVEMAGTPAPDFVLKSVSGSNLRLSEYRGRVVLLGFWVMDRADRKRQREMQAALAQPD